MFSSSSLAKVWFVLSLIVLFFGYGFASHAWNLFPKSYVEQAWREGRDLVSEDRGPGLKARFYDRSGARLVAPKKIQTGLTLVTSRWEDSTIVRLINKEGNTVHKWPTNLFGVFDEKNNMVHGSHLITKSGDIVFNMEYIGSVRVNSCGNIKWKVQNKNHHSVERASDGTFWTPAVSSKKKKDSDEYPNGYPGLSKKVWVEYVDNISPKGEVLRRINVLNVIFDNRELFRQLKKVYRRRPIDADITHMNDVDPLRKSLAGEYPSFEAGDLLISLLRLNLVFVLDPKTEEVKWYVTGPLIGQHDPDWLGNGWINIFNNSTKWGGEGGSEVLSFNPRSDSMVAKFPSEKSPSFFTSVQGKAQQLRNGNLLLTESQRGRVIEVDPEGQVVWEWIKKPLSSSTTAVVGEASRYNITLKQVASWPCSSVDSVNVSSTTQ